MSIQDETLRDGLQSASACDPPIAKKIELLELMVSASVDAVSVGYPKSSPRAAEGALALARHVAVRGFPIEVSCAARTLVTDVHPIVEIAQASGRGMTVYAFLGSSPIRQYVHGWEVASLARTAREAISFAAREGLRVAFVIEDASRSHPETLRTLIETAADAGACRICIADTVGHATPDGARAIVAFAKRTLSERGLSLALDWHGHNDRGLSLPSALAAASAGVDRVHATVLGIGERTGNTPLEDLVAHLRPDLSEAAKLLLSRYVEAATAALLPRSASAAARRSRGDSAYLTP